MERPDRSKSTHSTRHASAASSVEFAATVIYQNHEGKDHASHHMEKDQPLRELRLRPRQRTIDHRNIAPLLSIQETCRAFRQGSSPPLFTSSKLLPRHAKEQLDYDFFRAIFPCDNLTRLRRRTCRLVGFHADRARKWLAHKNPIRCWW